MDDKKKFVIGTIKTQINGKEMPYYPRTTSDAVFFEKEPGESVSLKDLFDNGELGGKLQLEQKVVSTVLVHGGKRIDIPVLDYSPEKYTFMVFINSTFVVPRRYKVNHEAGFIELVGDEKPLKPNKVVDFVFYSLKRIRENTAGEVPPSNNENNSNTTTKREQLVQQKETEVKSTYKGTAAVPVLSWKKDNTEKNYSYSAIVKDSTITRSDSLCVDSDNKNISKNIVKSLKGGFKVFSSEIPKTEIQIKYYYV